MRVLGIRNAHYRARSLYDLPDNSLVVPETVFENPMTLIPLGEVIQWYRALEEKTGDEDAIINLTRDVAIDKLGPVSRWIFSGIDLASTIRRLNHSFQFLHSGAYLAGTQSGNIIKWTYRNPLLPPDAQAHDSIRVAMFMLKVLRIYLGDAYTPLRVQLSGKRERQKLYEDYFGCEVEWHQPQTEVWLKVTDRLALKKEGTSAALAMNLNELDDFLNMPDAEDEIKVVYELVNYSRHYGLPTVDKVASLQGLSSQQFQRRLQKLGLNFSTVSGFVLSNVAVSLMSKGLELDDIANRLGYSNLASFNRMFKKHRGITPVQFAQRF